MRWAWVTLLLLLVARVAWPVALRESSPRLAVESLREHHRFAPRAQRPSVPHFHVAPPLNPAGDPPASLDPWGQPFGCARPLLLGCHVVLRYYSFGPNRRDDLGRGDDIWLDAGPPLDLGRVALAYLPDALLVGAASIVWCMGCWWLGRGQRRTALLLPLVPSLAAWTFLDEVVSARSPLSWLLLELPLVQVAQAPRSAALTLACLLGALGWARSRHPRSEAGRASDACA